MATLKNTIKKAEKLSGTKISKDSNGKYIVFYKGYGISFYCNGKETETSESTCHYVKKVGNKDDMTTDYFAGTFWDNITQCFASVDRMTK
jgi:hypothetical protein